MAEMKLDGGNTQQRNMLVPILVAIVLLAVGGAWFAKVYLHPEVTATARPLQTFEYTAKYQRGGGVLVGQDQQEVVTYVIADIALKDNTEVPLFLKTIDGSLTMEDGTVMTANAIEKADLPRLAAMFPDMKPKVDAVAPAPLLRESTIAPGATNHGYVIFAYNVPQSVWDKRKAADVTITFYHQDTVKVSLPK
ncbi:MAG TPA: hypothetical protein VIM67_08480 [Terriglobus sp.]